MSARWWSGLLATGSVVGTLSVAAQTPAMGARAGVRADHLMPSAGPTQSAVRLDAMAKLRRRLGAGALAVEGTGALTRPADPRTPARELMSLTAQWSASPRQLGEPRLRLSGERGTTRASDLTDAPLEPRPDGDLLRSDRLRAEGEARWTVGAGGALRTTVAGERGGGLGADTAVLPRLSRATLQWELGPRLGSSEGWRLQGRGEQLRMDGQAPWRSLAMSGSWRRRLSPAWRLTADVGAVLAANARAEAVTAPRAVLQLSRAARRGQPALELAVSQSPEVDRLDGTLRVRRRAQAGIETRPVSSVSIRGSAQALADVDGSAPRRALAVDLLVSARLGALGRLETGLARLVQRSGMSPTRGETRLTLGLRLTPIGRLCRSSC